MTDKELTPEEQLRVFITDDGKMLLRCKSLRYYNVFKIEDTDLSTKHDKTKGLRFDWEPHAKADRLIAAYVDKTGVIIEHGGNRAFQQGNRYVTLPNRAQFKNASEYYSTMFHELIHSTSGKCGRDLKSYSTNKKVRAREELTAEIGAAYIMSYLGIESEFTQANSAAYVKSWAHYLKDDKSAIFYAAPKAIEAAEVIINS